VSKHIRGKCSVGLSMTGQVITLVYQLLKKCKQLLFVTIVILFCLSCKLDLTTVCGGILLNVLVDSVDPTQDLLLML